MAFGEVPKTGYDFSTMQLSDRIGRYFRHSPSPMLNYSAEHPFGQHIDANQLSCYGSNYIEEQIDQLQTFGSPDDTRSDLSITVPIAINHESPSTIKTLLEQVEKAAQPLGKVSVLLWANERINSQSTNRQISQIQQSSRQNYAKLQQLINSHPTSITYLTGLQIAPSNEMSMSKIRYTMMGIILERARRLGYDDQHPVMWLDADTTHLSKNALSSSVRLLEQAAFVHPTIKYSAEWTEGFSDKNIASSFIIDEIINRAYQRSQPPGTHSPYPEESGLVFTLDTYLKAGGVDSRFPIGESRRLIDRYDSYLREHPSNIIHQRQTLVYDAASHIITSGRRFAGVDPNNIAADMQSFRASTRDYRLWSGMETAAKEVACTSLNSILEARTTYIMAMGKDFWRRIFRLADKLEMR